MIHTLEAIMPSCPTYQIAVNDPDRAVQRVKP